MVAEADRVKARRAMSYTGMHAPNSPNDIRTYGDWPPNKQKNTDKQLH